METPPQPTRPAPQPFYLTPKSSPQAYADPTNHQQQQQLHLQYQRSQSLTQVQRSKSQFPAEEQQQQQQPASSFSARFKRPAFFRSTKFSTDSTTPGTTNAAAAAPTSPPQTPSKPLPSPPQQPQLAYLPPVSHSTSQLHLTPKQQLHERPSLYPLPPLPNQIAKEQPRQTMKQAPREQLRPLPKQISREPPKFTPKEQWKHSVTPGKQHTLPQPTLKTSKSPPAMKTSPPPPRRNLHLPPATPPPAAPGATTAQPQLLAKGLPQNADAQRRGRKGSCSGTGSVRRRSSSTERTEGLSHKPHKDRFPLRCIYVSDPNNKTSGKVVVMNCIHGTRYTDVLAEFSARWNIDVFQRDSMKAFFLDCTELSGKGTMDMDRNEWLKKAFDIGVVPTVVIMTKDCYPGFTKRECWNLLFGKPSVVKPQENKRSTEENYLLQIRVSEGAQIVNAYCSWETTLADIRSKVVPMQLKGHNGPKIMSQVIVDTPTVLGTLSENDVNRTSFFELCKAAYCIPHVMIRETVPRDIAPIRCETHHSDCVIVDPADPTSHYPESKASDFRINMEISKILKDKSAPKRSQNDRETEFTELTAFRAAAKRLRFSVLGGSGFGAIAYAELPRAISSSPHAFPPGEMLLAAVKLPLRDMVKTLPIRPGISADAFAENIFDKFCASLAPPDKKASDYVLKVKGINSYIWGSEPVLHFAHVQSALLKKARPELIFIERPPEDQSFAREEHYTFANLLAIRDDGIEYRYENIAMRNVPAARRVCTPSWDLTTTPFRVKVIGIDKTQAGVDPGKQCFVVVELFYGDCPLCKQAVTSKSMSLQWNEMLTFDIMLSQIPLEARVCFTLYALASENESQMLQQQIMQQQGQMGDSQQMSQQSLQMLQQQQQLQAQCGVFEKPLGWVSCTVFDYMNTLCKGRKIFYLWPNERANPAGGSWENCTAAKSSGKLIVDFEDYLTPVVFPTHGTPPVQISSFAPITSTSVSSRKGSINSNLSSSSSGSALDGSIDQQKVLADIEAKDSLYRLTEVEKKILWEHRTSVMQRPRLLGKILQALNYRNPADVIEGHKLMSRVFIAPEDALELLASKFPDKAVREYAVQSLRRMPTEDLMSYLLELVQALKYEPRHNSALASLLLEKGYLSSAVGTELYWALKSGITYGDSPERFQAVMDAFLRGCGEGRNAILLQEEFLGNLQVISREVKALKDSERLDHLHRRLREVSTPRGLFVPVRPDFLIGGIEIDKCSYKDSKKLPLYVVLRNAEAGCDSFHMIFKEGDDLRQDGLTLQMIRLMDKMWKDVGLDLEMLPYRTICTEAASGLIEVVLNSKTTAEIHKAAGGASAAFKQDPLANWLRQHNPTEDMYRPCVKRFLKSCAGYCVATYVLGIGDRHNDNIMLSKAGNLFHIDFGHFLGHKKYFLGFNREPASFVFTPDFAYVMGGKGAPDFEEFVETACRAYLVLRKHSSTFINLFALMLSTGIPELKSQADIDYLRDAFALGLGDADASKRFKDLIYSSLATWTTRLNNAIHIAMH